MRLGFRIDLREIYAMESRVRKEIVPKAAAAAINRAATATATAAGREISAATKIPAREVRKRIIVRKAHPNKLRAEVEMLPLTPSLSKSYFKPTQNKAGVAATAWERRKTYKHAFKMPNGRVVTRTTKQRFPIKGLKGPSATRTFMQDRVQTKLDAVARQTWRTRMEHELARRMMAGL